VHRQAEEGGGGAPSTPPPVQPCNRSGLGLHCWTGARGKGSPPPYLLARLAHGGFISVALEYTGAMSGFVKARRATEGKGEATEGINGHAVVESQVRIAIAEVGARSEYRLPARLPAGAAGTRLRPHGTASAMGGARGTQVHSLAGLHGEGFRHRFEGSVPATSGACKGGLRLCGVRGAAPRKRQERRGPVFASLIHERTAGWRPQRQRKLISL
jgi:hypothetical protein